MLPLRAILAVSACVCWFVACAEGDQIDTGFNEVGGGGVGGDGGDGSTTSTTSAQSSSSSGPTTTASSSSSSTGGGGCDAEAPNECASAEDLGEVKGDDGNDIVVESGNTSKWYKVRITESVSSPIPPYPQLSYQVSLESPPGADYDLFVYPGDTVGVDCLISPQQGFGDPEAVTATWGDSLMSEDGTYFTFEVRYVDGADCDADWTLTVEGHTNP